MDGGDNAAALFLAWVAQVDADNVETRVEDGDPDGDPDGFHVSRSRGCAGLSVVLLVGKGPLNKLGLSQLPLRVLRGQRQTQNDSSRCRHQLLGRWRRKASNHRPIWTSTRRYESKRGSSRRLTWRVLRVM